VWVYIQGYHKRNIHFHGTDMLASKKSRLNSLWLLLVGVYGRQKFRSSTSGKFKRTETTHHNSCCKCWRRYAQVCLGQN
jgi:hypothetical protein